MKKIHYWWVLNTSIMTWWIHVAESSFWRTHTRKKQCYCHSRASLQRPQWRLGRIIPVSVLWIETQDASLLNRVFVSSKVWVDLQVIRQIWFLGTLGSFRDTVLTSGSIKTTTFILNIWSVILICASEKNTQKYNERLESNKVRTGYEYRWVILSAVN